jgi:uncharacterized membrane protein
MSAAQQELTTPVGGDLAERQDVDPILVMIQSAARDPDADVDKMERLMAMYERQQEKHAESAFNRAMNQAQKRVSRVAADANNNQTRSKYATYAALDRALRPVYTDCGFSLSFDTGDTEKPDTVRVVCHVSHEDGHTRTYHADMPADGKGAKGGDVMTKTHAAGSAMSYGMRYLLKLIFNVAIGEDDNDGNAPTKYISDDDLTDLVSLMDELDDKLDRSKFDKWLASKGVNEYKRIPSGMVRQVFDMLERKRKS